ncbi:hypothetical protein AQPE_3057 [Aquipluma nitroreducens]|uniref:Oligosaccharide repeat unit polymerase n=1 Tax=Aquipluma nitroreducens TaxID=2010828 RepID=A0A5K7SBP7_9BACT|nr:DUF6337 family protein [Aquipluma nitroreducens]BBE18887.1 hypothetical protein AQPE_3057 [Aquipluma nitroreducens]
MLIIITQFILFGFFLVSINYIDRKIWGTNYTPIAILGWPFFILLIICYIYLKINFKQFELNSLVLPIWLGGLFSFWIGGFFLKFIFTKAKINLVQLNLSINEFSITKYQLQLLITIAYPLIIIAGYKIYGVLLKFRFNIADDEFQKNLGAGFIGHSILLLTILTIFFIIFFSEKNYKIHQILIILTTLLFAVLYGVKSWIIIPLISAFVGRIFLTKTKLKLKHIIYLIIPFLIFWLIYQISLGMSSLNNKFIFNHIVDYLLSGPIGFSAHLDQNLPIGKNPEYAFTPLINIFRFLIGKQPLDVISNYIVSIPTGFETNVKTFFGSLFIYGGYSYIITSFVLGLILYAYLLIVVLTINTKIAPFFIINYSFMLGLLFMGWFEIYVIHLDFYEVPFFAFLMHFLLRLKL